MTLKMVVDEKETDYNDEKKAGTKSIVNVLSSILQQHNVIE